MPDLCRLRQRQRGRRTVSGYSSKPLPRLCKNHRPRAVASVEPLRDSDLVSGLYCRTSGKRLSESMRDNLTRHRASCISLRRPRPFIAAAPLFAPGSILSGLGNIGRIRRVEMSRVRLLGWKGERTHCLLRCERRGNLQCRPSSMPRNDGKSVHCSRVSRQMPTRIGM